MHWHSLSSTQIEVVDKEQHKIKTTDIRVEFSYQMIQFLCLWILLTENSVVSDKTFFLLKNKNNQNNLFFFAWTWTEKQSKNCENSSTQNNKIDMRAGLWIHTRKYGGENFQKRYTDDCDDQQSMQDWRTATVF